MFVRSIKTSYANWYMLICVLAVAAVMLLGIYGENVHKQSVCDVLYYFELTLGVGHVQLLLPIVSGIPFILGFYTECKAGYQSSCLTRCHRGKYVWVKGITAFLTGYGVVFLGAVLFVLAVLLLGIGNEIVFTEQMTGGMDGFVIFWQGLVQKGLGWLDLAIRVMLFGCIGGIWSIVCFALCSFSLNKYLIIAIPCLLVIVLPYVIALPFMPAAMQYLDPGFLMLKGGIQDNWDGGISHVLLYTLCVLILGMLLYRTGLERRRIHG